MADPRAHGIAAHQPGIRELQQIGCSSHIADPRIEPQVVSIWIAKSMASGRGWAKSSRLAKNFIYRKCDAARAVSVRYNRQATGPYRPLSGQEQARCKNRWTCRCQFCGGAGRKPPTSRNSESHFMVNSYLITFSNGNTNRSTFVSHPPMRINMWTRREPHHPPCGAPYFGDVHAAI